MKSNKQQRMQEALRKSSEAMQPSNIGRLANDYLQAFLEQPVQSVNPVQNLNQVQELNPVQISQPLQDLKQVQDLMPPQDLNRVQLAEPVQIVPAAKPEPPSRIAAPSKSEPGARIEPATKFEPAKGFTQVPNSILDGVFPELDQPEQSIYLRLYRLSYGFGEVTCRAAVPTLAKRCNCSENTVRVAIRKLASKGLIRVVTVSNTGAKDGGTIFEVYQEIGAAFKFEPGSKSEGGSNAEPGSIAEAGSRSEPIKDHDHDSLNKDHQSAVMTIYQSLTGNNWKDADRAAYQKICAVPAATIETVIRTVIARAGQRPGSLAYFVKEILDAANPAPAARKASRAQLQAIVERVRSAYVGAALPPSELEERVRAICEREGVLFDKLIFNEIAG